MNALAEAEIMLATLWATWAPWLQPEMLSLVLGHWEWV